MSECLIAFGGNLSNPKVNFQLALVMLCESGFSLRQKSGLWQSPAWPAGSDTPDYLNAVVAGYFDGEPEALLRQMLAIETALGRKRTVANAARTLDLDLLIFGQVTRDTEALTLPHPRMLDRGFVMIPACEIDEKWLQYVEALPDVEIRATRYVGQW